MTYTVRKVAHGEYELVDLAVDGQPLDENRVYKVLMVGSKTLMEHADYFNNPILRHWTRSARMREWVTATFCCMSIPLPLSVSCLSLRIM